MIIRLYSLADVGAGRACIPETRLANVFLMILGPDFGARVSLERRLGVDDSAEWNTNTFSVCKRLEAVMFGVIFTVDGASHTPVRSRRLFFTNRRRSFWKG